VKKAEAKPKSPKASKKEPPKLGLFGALPMLSNKRAVKDRVRLRTARATVRLRRVASFALLANKIQ